MPSEIKDPFATVLPKDPGTQLVTSTVEVVAVPSAPPEFRFLELEGQDITITHEQGEVTLTLQNPPTGFPEGSQVKFVPLVTAPTQPPTDGPITWRLPGTKEATDRPQYIQMPDLNGDATTLHFSFSNTAETEHDVVISFTINVLLTVPGLPEQTLSSPDPTIINVDPPGLV